MRNHLTCSTILVAALAGANPALAAASQTVALPPHPDRVLLQPGECGSAVTGEHRLRWFCAAAVSDDAAGIEAVQEGPPGQARLLEQQVQTEDRLKDVQQQLVAAQNASEARRRQAEAQAAQTIAGLRDEIETLKAERVASGTAAEQTIVGLREEIETLKAERVETTAAAEQTVAGLREEIETLEAERVASGAAAEQTIAGLRDEIETLKAERVASGTAAEQTIAGLRDEIEAQNALLATSEQRAASYRALLGDSDQDGVVDPSDLCGGTVAGRTIDRSGCAIGDEIVLRGVGFAWSSMQLTPEARRSLDVVAQRLIDHPDVYFEVAGHTDSTGDAESNRKLSTLRAEAVRDYLLTKGVSADRLVAVGYGDRRPVADNNDEAGRALNRRVSLVRLE